MLTLPLNIGRITLREGGVRVCPPLKTSDFLRFCKARDIILDKERLVRLERLGLFRPVFRVRKPARARNLSAIRLPLQSGDRWFRNRWAWDTTSIDSEYSVPDASDSSQEAFYSIFQIDHLEMVLQGMTLSVHLESYLERERTGSESDCAENSGRWLDLADRHAEHIRTHEFRCSLAMLCQYISDRYYPQAQTDQRNIRLSVSEVLAGWITMRSFDWDWEDYVRNWRPTRAERLFDLTPEKLKRAYQAMALAQSSCDPLSKWYQLVQFVAVAEREKLQGAALRAETLRSAAYMLRLLYKDLYEQELPHPNEAHATVINWIPELEIREDRRRYLEFVVNRYRLNPQPTLVLLVEGESEIVMIERIFREYFGASVGTHSIELVNLQGIGSATGKKKDNYSALLRLIDYLHHHQTFAFLILDNENDAKKMKDELKNRKSIHHDRRYVTRPEYIKIWRSSLEIDNFSATEIAQALTKAARNKSVFSRTEVTEAKGKKRPASELSTLYEQKTGRGLGKRDMANILTDIMMEPASSRAIANRPMVKVLERVVKLAGGNPFPTMLEVWEKNQSSRYLGKKR